jgi:hypothetical protein
MIFFTWNMAFSFLSILSDSSSAGKKKVGAGGVSRSTTTSVLTWVVKSGLQPSFW